MAQLLYDRQSTNVHLNATRRHIRLCRQIKGGEQFATRIEPYYNALLDKQQASQEAAYEREAARDDVVLHDGDLDNALHTLDEKCKQYDRDNPGRSVRDIIFPGGKSLVIYAKYEEEPDLAEQLLARLASLGEEHPLNDQKGVIREGIDKCKAALSVYHEAIKAEKLKEAEEEIAKSNLGRQYEYNYLDLAREFGKKYANRFFPIIRSTGKSAKEEDDNTGEAE